MITDMLALTTSVLSLLFTALGTYIAYKEYIVRTREKPKEKTCKHSKSNRQSLRKITVAFTIQVTKK